jgi:hypothetical protein
VVFEKKNAFFSKGLALFPKTTIFAFAKRKRFSNCRFGGIAQLARALAWHARGQGFDSPYLHQITKTERASKMPFFLCPGLSVLVVCTAPYRGVAKPIPSPLLANPNKNT